MIGVSTMRQRQLAIAVATVIGAVLTVGNVKEGLRVFSLAGSVLGGTYLAYDRWIWRWKWTRRLTGVPLLDGTWEGELASTHPSGSKPGRGVTKAAYLVIRQSGSEIQVRMITDEMESLSESADLVRGSEGRWSLSWNYKSVPRRTVKDSPQHRGFAEVRVPSQVGERMLGSYYTDRLSSGDLAFSERADGHFSDVDAARKAFSP